MIPVPAFTLKFVAEQFPPDHRLVIVATSSGIADPCACGTRV